MISCKHIESSTTVAALLVLVFSTTLSAANNNQALQPDDSRAATSALQSPAVEESIHALLIEGYYAVDVTCDAQGAQAGSVIDNNMPNDCTAHLEFTRLSADGHRIVTHRTAFNPVNGMWEKEDQDLIAQSNLLSWQSGSWQVIRDNSPNRLIETVNDDAAIIATGTGQMLARTVSEDLSNKPARLHAKVSESTLKPTINSADVLFPEQARKITLSLQPQSTSHVLFSFQQDASVTRGSYCPGAEKNCNVVQITQQGENWLVPDVQTLQKASMHGVQIVALRGHPSNSEPLHVFLEADAVRVDTASAASLTQLPIAGSSTWSVADEPAVLAATDADLSVLECQDNEERASVTTQYEGRLDEVAQTLYAPEPCASLTGVTATGPTDGATTIDNQQTLDGAQLVNEPSGRILGSTRWRLIESDGLQRIEIDLPVAVQHHLQSDSTEAIILTEHEGILRAGATIRGFGVSSIDVYNQVAFDALRPIIEKFVSH